MKAVPLFLILFSASLLPAQPPGYRLVWSDEFDVSGLPDPVRWNYERGMIRNNEAQFYTAARPENARIENGVLVIEARREDWRQGNVAARYTSASVTTQCRQYWRYGRVEVRAKLPAGRGTWPAIWMLGQNIDTAGWPKCGEIDIMENVGFDPDTIHANIHTDAYNHVKGTNKGNRITVLAPHSDFHVYALEWTPERIVISVDGKPYFTYEKESAEEAVWPFDQPFYLILNLAIGGTWGGQKGIDDSIFPQRFEIDYVRVCWPPCRGPRAPVDGSPVFATGAADAASDGAGPAARQCCRRPAEGTIDLHGKLFRGPPRRPVSHRLPRGGRLHS